MAFGLPPKYKDQIQVNTIPTRQTIILVLEALKKLGWNTSSSNVPTIIAYTDFSMLSWSEKITIKIGEGHLEIVSQCTGSQLLDYGKNKKNIDLFISTFNELKRQADIKEDYSDLTDEVSAHHKIDKHALQSTEIESSTGLLSLIMPTKNYLITPVLVLLNLIVFVLMAVNGVHIMEPDSESLLQWGANFRPLTAEGEYWRLLSSCFVHIGIFHLLMNMYALLYIGPLLEPYLGKTRFLGAYLLTGIAASVTSLYWNDYTVSAGASGAIFGMYGVFLAMLTTNVIEKSTRKPLLTSIAAFVGYNLLFGLKGGIDNAAHIGGLISGMVIGYCFYPSLVKPSIIRLKYTTVSLLAITILISSYLVVSAVQPGDMVTYEKEMAEFSILEEKALSIYNMPETASDQLILKKIKNTGIPSWEASLDLFERVEKLDLPDALAEQNILMKKYCELRLKSYELIYKAVSEGTDSYQEELDTYNAEIEAIINNLNATAL